MKFGRAKSFNDVSLRNKVLISFALFLVLPFLIISIVIIIQFRNVMVDRAYQQAEEKMIRTRNRTIDTLSKALSVADRVSVNPDLEYLINRRYSDTLEVFFAYHDFIDFTEFVTYNPEISAIRIYIDNPTLLNNWEIIPLKPGHRNTIWFKDAIEAGGQNSWLGFRDVTKNGNSFLSLVRKLDFREYDTTAVLVIDINTVRLSAILAQESYETFLIDRNGRILAAHDPNLVGSSYYDLGGEFPALTSPPGEYRITMDSREYYLLIDRINMPNSSNDVYLFSLFSLSSIVRQGNSVLNLGLRLITINFLLALAALYIINSVFVRRLIKVGKKMDIVAQGHFHSLLEIDGKDEIGRLAQRFNNMVRNINNLMQEIRNSHDQRRKIEKHQNEIKLKMMASQINPHFLFNSLEAIRMKAHLEKQPQIANIVKQLGKLMRKVLDIGGGWNRLSDELEITKSFLEIEKFRLAELLHYTLNIEPDCYSVTLPPLLLQPLVENAVIHGVEKIQGGGTVTISAKISGDDMVVTVEDHGPGICPEKIEELLHSESMDESSHIGIRNVHERLVLSFGNQAGLRISESPGGGAHIEFYVPRRKNDA